MMFVYHKSLNTLRTTHTVKRHTNNTIAPPQIGADTSHQDRFNTSKAFSATTVMYRMRNTRRYNFTDVRMTYALFEASDVLESHYCVRGEIKQCVLDAFILDHLFTAVLHEVGESSRLVVDDA